MIIYDRLHCSIAITSNSVKLMLRPHALLLVKIYFILYYINMSAITLAIVVIGGTCLVIGNIYNHFRVAKLEEELDLRYTSRVVYNGGVW